MAATLPLAPFGSTAHQSSRLLFGAAALGDCSQDFADRLLAKAFAAGINHIDTAASYGAAEDRLQPFLTDHRSAVFLATKTDKRSGDGARAELEHSLQRMGVESVDLIQLHNLVEDDEWAQAFAPGGAVAALDRARAEGLVRFIGVTGHGLRIPGMHLRSLAEYPFSSVLFPWNHTLAAIPSYRADVAELMSTCRSRGAAMQTIKSSARRRWTRDEPDGRYSWYEPLGDAAAIARAVRFVLATPDLFLNTSSDARLFDTIVATACSPDATVAPDPTDLAADRAAQGMEPIFDGGSLERI